MPSPKTADLSAFVALIALSAALSGCTENLDPLSLAARQQKTGPTGGNNIGPYGVDSRPLKRDVTDSFGLTGSGQPDPLPLCQVGTITTAGTLSSCTLRTEWDAWLNAAPEYRDTVMKGIAKCTVGSDFTFVSQDGSRTFPGQWSHFPEWKTDRLVGQDKRERVSACILSLLNGDNQTYMLCVMGPGGAPFSTPCSDPTISNREGGFFGDLFAANPTAYVAGPDISNYGTNGRVCTSDLGASYCCAESDTSCTHQVVLAGSILGTADDGYAGRRCNKLETAGSYTYCSEYFSRREPDRVYHNVFTSFVPPK